MKQNCNDCGGKPMRGGSLCYGCMIKRAKETRKTEEEEWSTGWAGICTCGRFHSPHGCRETDNDYTPVPGEG